jgi:hypothetical protein
MLVTHVTVHAQIIVFAGKARNKVFFRKALDTTVASARWFIIAFSRLLLIGISSRYILSVFSLDLGRDALGGAVNDITILYEALHHPVAGTWAVDASVDTSRAKIIVATVADTTVEVLVFHGMVAVIAVHYPRGANVVRLGSERKTGIVVSLRRVVEEAWFCY